MFKIIISRPVIIIIIVIIVVFIYLNASPKLHITGITLARRRPRVTFYPEQPILQWYPIATILHSTVHYIHVHDGDVLSLLNLRVFCGGNQRD